MFGLSKGERALYERLLAEKDRLILALSDQVDWHRAHAGTYVPNHLTGPAEPQMSEADEAFQQLLENLQVGNPRAMHMSEDEEEILWQVQHGADPDAAAAAMAALANARELPFDAD